MKFWIKSLIVIPLMPLIWLGRFVERKEYDARNPWACGGRAAIINDWRYR